MSFSKSEIKPCVFVPYNVLDLLVKKDKKLSKTRMTTLDKYRKLLDRNYKFSSRAGTKNRDLVDCLKFCLIPSTFNNNTNKTMTDDELILLLQEGEDELYALSSEELESMLTDLEYELDGGLTQWNAVNFIEELLCEEWALDEEQKLLNFKLPEKFFETRLAKWPDPSTVEYARPYLSLSLAIRIFCERKIKNIRAPSFKCTKEEAITIFNDLLGSSYVAESMSKLSADKSNAQPGVLYVDENEALVFIKGMQKPDEMPEGYITSGCVARQDAQMIRNVLDRLTLRNSNNVQIKRVAPKDAIKTSNYFVEQERIRSAMDVSEPLNDELNMTRMIGKIYGALMRGTFNDFAAQCYRDLVPGQFNPIKVREVVEHVRQMYPNKEIKRMFNGCGGWGDRIIGAMVTHGIEQYTQTDPNINLIAPYIQMINTLSKPQIIVKNDKEEYKGTFSYGEEDCKKISIHLLGHPIESLPPENMTSMRSAFDISLTSPPYFSKERYDYQSKSNTQSYQRFSDYGAWCDGFLKPFISVNNQVLKPDGLFCVNIADVKSQGAEYQVATDFNSLMKKKYGAFFEEVPGTKYMSNRGGNHSGSSIYIYKKIADMQSINIGQNAVDAAVPAVNRSMGFFSESDAAVPAVNLSDSRKRKRDAASASPNYVMH